MLNWKVVISFVFLVFDNQLQFRCRLQPTILSGLLAPDKACFLVLKGAGIVTFIEDIGDVE